MTIQRCNKAFKDLFHTPDDYGHDISHLSYCILGERPEQKFKMHRDAPCYISLDRANEKGWEAKYLLIWDFAASDCLSSVQKIYLRWLATDSAFADAFHTKNPNIMFKRGTIMNVNYTPQYVFGACVASRYVRENPDLVNSWNLLRKYMSADAALIFAHYFTPSSQNRMNIHSPFYPPGHKFINSVSFKQHHLRNFVDHKHDTTRTKHFRWNRNYYNSAAIWNGIVSKTPNHTGGAFDVTLGIAYVSIEVPSLYAVSECRFTQYNKKIELVFNLDNISEWAPHLAISNGVE